MRGSHLLESRRYGRRRAAAIYGGRRGRGFGHSDASGGCAMVAGFGARGRGGDDASIFGKTCWATRFRRGSDISLPVSVYGGAAARARPPTGGDRSGCRGRGRGRRSRSGTYIACRRKILWWQNEFTGC